MAGYNCRHCGEYSTGQHVCYGTLAASGLGGHWDDGPYRAWAPPATRADFPSRQAWRAHQRGYAP